MNIIFFGLGSIGKRHFKNLKAISQKFNFYAYRVRNNPLNEEFNEIVVVKNLDKVKLLKIDLAIISSPPSAQEKILSFVVQNSINFFVEKPIGIDYNNLSSLIPEIKIKNLISMVGFNLRFHPLHFEIKKIISSSKFGKVYSIRSMVGQYLPDWHPNEDYSKGYSANKHLGGGVLLDLTHEIDFTYSLLGDFIDYKSFFGKLSSINSDSEDLAEIIIRFKKHNAIGSIRLDYIQKYPQRSGQIIGENQILFYDLLNSKIEVFDKNGLSYSNHLENFNRNDMYLSQMKCLIKSVTNKKIIENDFESGLKILKLVNDVKDENGWTY